MQSSGDVCKNFPDASIASILASGAGAGITTGSLPQDNPADKKFTYGLYCPGAYK
jgi:hypothetical protein